MRVLVRADASAAIGSGHVARCLTLAQVLRDMGAEVLFACRELPGNAFARLAQEGFAALVLPPLYCGENPALGIEALLPWDCRPCASPLRKTSRPTPSAWPRLACISISAPAGR
ncbi:hypothetical protein PHLH7_46760 [Pseudomonas sp. Ost2]|uniref:hypothetical protein n=1 Tax=Pseudomonas TaxID=286 RepID=UPI001BF0CAFA|nr:hypothetical protein [Pseudomonas gingeri]BBP78572.1 hypothetical protein PHLH7_46760 [Pseudomonas sp. Ost2]